MIGRGRQNDILLFEITEQDLLGTKNIPATYQAGNVLLFDCRQSIDIGLELARADDLNCAFEFLAAQSLPGDTCDNAPSTEALAEIEQLKNRLEQRDGLLSEFADQLKRQKEENELLQLLLDQTQSQIALEAAARDEMMDDLKQASADTLMIEHNFERAIEEKMMLEQELAEKITELLESSMINDDLRRQIRPDSDEPGIDSVVDLLDTDYQIAADKTQIYTMTSGKQIHVYHEFPSITEKRPGQLLQSIFRISIRAAMTIILLLVLTLIASVLATSFSNRISLGEALDLILSRAFFWIN